MFCWINFIFRTIYYNILFGYNKDIKLHKAILRTLDAIYRIFSSMYVFQFCNVRCLEIIRYKKHFKD